MIQSGDTINFPYITDMRVQSYTSGTDLTIDDFTASQSSLTINRSKAATAYIDPEQVKQAEDKGYPEKLAKQAAFVLAQELDQKVLQDGVDNANNTVAGGSISASSVYSTLTDCMASLQRSNAQGPYFAVLDPERVALLAQSEVANGFNVADNALMNGFVGDSQAGFKIFNSNNLPTSVTLTLATNPTADDTLTVAGVTWTFKATPASAGEIDVGANAAASQADVKDALNGEGTPAATSYIEISTANRRKYQNIQLTCSAFTSDVATITAYGKQGNSSSLTATTDGFGTETGNLLCGSIGSIAIARQMTPQLFIRPEPKQIGDNYITHQLYGTTVFERDQERLVNLTLNV